MRWKEEKIKKERTKNIRFVDDGLGTWKWKEEELEDKKRQWKTRKNIFIGNRRRKNRSGSNFWIFK